ncbi:MAG: hypothetical protein PHT49_05565 [Desulfovibrionales bacterium]|nr:hypothetical protein [Desulfovibrionales bacterium]
MLKVLNKKHDIDNAQKIFLTHFFNIVDKKINVKIGYPGGNFKSKVSWLAKLGIWVCSFKRSGRHINLFGVGEPEEGDMIPITCEINFPVNGINRRIGGAFLTDSTGDIFVAHRGKIGGGKKGIGKSLFEDQYRGRWEIVEDNGFDTEVALISALKSPRFVNQVRQFVFEVNRIKSLSSIPSSQPISPADSDEFKEEFSGKKRQYKTSRIIEAECDHGLIVNNLSSVLEELGLTVRNDKNRDIYIIDSNRKITAIFEVKTDTSTTSMYSAVGQLLLNSISLTVRPRLILVIPEQVDKTLESKLKQLGIESLIFKWVTDRSIFPKLKTLNL